MRKIEVTLLLKLCLSCPCSIIVALEVTQSNVFLSNIFLKFHSLKILKSRPESFKVLPVFNVIITSLFKTVCVTKGLNIYVLSQMRSIFPKLWGGEWLLSLASNCPCAVTNFQTVTWRLGLVLPVLIQNWSETQKLRVNLLFPLHEATESWQTWVPKPGFELAIRACV